MKKILLLPVLWISLLHAAQYQVSVKGISAGEADLAIVNHDDSYRVTLTLYPNWKAKLFGIDDMQESSKGQRRYGHFYPTHYQRITLKGKSLFSVLFDNGRAIQNDDGKKTVFAVDLKGQDPLSQIAQIQYNLSHNGVASHYFLVTKSTQRKYSAITFSKGASKKVVLTQTPKPERIIRLWFDNDNQLLRMQKERRGKIDFDMIKQ